jgi:D-alanine--poly(phosphoribitol) ligase subunit 1
MPPLVLSSRIRNALAEDGERAIVEDAGGHWHMSASQLLAGAAFLFRALKPYADRPIVAYLQKSPLYYAFTACAFLNRLDFCPVDIDNPIERVIDVASQLAGSLILCDNQEKLAQLQQRTEHCLKVEVPFGSIEHELANEKEDRQDREASYYISTSGSTGVPKLVQILHDQTIPFIDWAVPFYGVNHDSRWAQFSSIGFDLSLVDFLTVLCGGGTLVSLSAHIDRIRPATTVARSRITHWHSVPSLIPYFLIESEQRAIVSNCRLFTFCGEPLMKADVDRLAERYPNARIINTYGPTETTLFCSFFEYVPTDKKTTEISLPIGQPIPSWNFVLLPEDGALRLIILSDNVSRGYVGSSSSQFSTIKLFGREMRAFDTGDFFQMTGSHLYFLHRKDLMVKVNGNRIDLGDVEAAAKRAGLINPIAIALGQAIYLIVEGTADGNPAAMSELSRFLPRGSLPAVIHFVSAHPRTINGKLDRRAIQVAFGRIHER